MYVSSIIKSYGDQDNVKKDVHVLNDIIGRQGQDLLLDVVSEHIGQCVLEFKLNEYESGLIKRHVLGHLEKALSTSEHEANRQ